MSGTLSNNQQMEYIFGAKAGQTVTLKVISVPKGNLFSFSVDGANGIELETEYDSYPEHRFAVIILTNKTNGLLLRTLEKAAELAVPLQPRPAPSTKQPLTITEVEMKNYVGAFENPPDYLRLELIVSDGKLFLRQLGATERSEVVKVGDNIFIAGGQEFLLIPGAKGRTKYMHIAGHALPRI